MTTIAYDGRFLVSDSCACIDDVILESTQQKIFHPGPEDTWTVYGKPVLAIGFSGSLTSLPWVKDALNEDVTHKTKITPDATHLDFHIIVVTEDGMAYGWAATRVPEENLEFISIIPLQGNFAVGSGCVFALSVMSIGRNAIDAVTAAIRLDPWTNGVLQVWELPSKKPVVSLFDVVTGDELWERVASNNLFKTVAKFPHWSGYTCEQLDGARDLAKSLDDTLGEVEKADQVVKYLEQFHPEYLSKESV